MHHAIRVPAVRTLALAAAVPILAFGYSERPNYRNTGAPGDVLCTLCHRDTVPNTRGGAVAVNFANGLTYTPGVRQEWTVTVTDPSGGVESFGFELTARLAANLANGQAGDFTPADPNTVVLCDNNALKGTQGCPANAAVQFVAHRLANRANTWRVAWTPPAANAGNVRIYVAGLAGNGDKETGDRIYTAEYELAPAGAPPALPAVSQSGVVNGASFRAGMSASAWVSIFGVNLASTAREWRGDEIVNGLLPLQLDDVSVTVNGKRAAIHYISPTQINVQVPAEGALGPVEVRVTNARGTSAATAVLERFAPGFFKFDPDARRYIAAVHADGVRVGRPNLLGAEVTRPAAPGDVLQIFATGFGPTDPPLPAGEVITRPAVLANSVLVRIGGVPAVVQWAGVSGAGLYQLNVLVPELPDGDAEVVAEIGGTSTGGGDFVTLRR